MDSGLTASDVLAMTKNEDGLFGGGGAWLIIILLFLIGGNGFGFGGNNGSRVATIEDLNNQSNFTRLENQVASNGALTERKMDGLSQGICNLGYTMAEKFGEVNSNIVAQTASIKEMMYQDKIETLQGQINALQLQNAMSGVVKYPTTTSYCSGANPFCGCGCNGNTL